DCGAFGSVELIYDDPPVEDVPIDAIATIADDVLNPTDFIFEWQFGEDGEEWEPSPSAYTQTDYDPATRTISSTFTPGDVEPGNHIRVIVSFLDDDGNRRTIVSERTASPVENVNDLPSGPDTIPTNPAVGDVLTAVNLADDDGIDEVIEDGTISYRWQRGSASTNTWTDITTTAQPFYRVTASEQGHQIRVIAEYTDDQGTAESATSAPTAVVSGPMPNNPPQGGLELTPATPQVGEEVVVTNNITDADGIPDGTPGDPTFVYTWRREISPGVWVTIPGPSGTVYVPSPDVEGQRIQVRVTYTDNRGFVETVPSDPSNPVDGPDVTPP